MIRILPLLAVMLFFTGFATVARAQSVCETLIVLDKNSGVARNQSCAPVQAKLTADYTFQNTLDPNKVEFRFFLNDGVTDFITVAGVADPLIPNKFSASVDYEYQQGQDCDFAPQIYIMYDGVLCTGTEQEQVFHVWNTDDTNPGPVTMDPVVAEFCPGTSIDNFVFYDETVFNCNKNLTNTNPNRQQRWVQFIYNTDDPANGGLIPDLTVNGVQMTNAAGDFVQGMEGPVETIPFPADGPEHYTLPISAPAGAEVGDYFEVTIRNWNVCNPYDATPEDGNPPADPVNGDFPPKVNTARILIVAPPEPEMSIFNHAMVETTNFCPNEKIRFEGNEDGGITGNLEYKWEFYNDEFGADFLSGAGNQDYWLESGFPDAGPKLIKLKVRREGTIEGCWAEISQVINVYNAPEVTAEINGVVQDELDLCFDAASAPTVNFSHELLSTNNYHYQYRTFQKNSTSDTPDGQDEPAVSVTGGNSANASFSATYTEPGNYRVWLVATDEVTDCETIHESIIRVNGQPQADFTVDNSCQGQATLFTDASSLPSAVAGDQITSWEWDVNKDGTVDYSTQNVSHTYAAAGHYQVVLKVTTQNGCSHQVEKEVEVFAIPEAELAYDYTLPICPGEPVNFSNLSFAGNNTAFDNKVSHSLIYSDGTNVEEVDLLTENHEMIFLNSTGGMLTYTVQLKAVAEESGCEKLSDPLTVEVKPGAAANFYEPNYSIFDSNCSLVDLEFMVDQSTLNIGGETHSWTIYKEGEEVYSNSFSKPTDPTVESEYHRLPFQAEASGLSGVVYEVHLQVIKNGQCVQPAVKRYRINPRPAPEDFPLSVSHDCEFTYINVKVEELAGVKELIWNISPEPHNLHELTYDEEFTLIYERPAKNTPAFQVELSLDKENFFGCRQEAPVVKYENVVPEIIETVEVQLESADAGACSPFTAEFLNTTDAPAGTEFELYVKYGIEEEKLVDINATDFEGNGDGLLNNFAYTFHKPGSYIVRMKAIGPDGCVLYSDGGLNLTVYDYPKPNFDLSQKEGCGPLTASFIKNIQNSIHNQWTITDLSDHSIQLDTDVDAEVSTFDFTNSSDVLKEYAVKLVATSSNGCSKDSVLNVKVYPEAEVSFELATAKLCTPFEVQVKNTSSGNPPGTTYRWRWEDGTTTESNEAELSHAYSNPSYSTTLFKNITLTAITPDGCNISTSKTVEILPRVEAAFTPSSTIGCAPLTLYLQNNSLGADSYRWEIREQGSSGAPIYTSNESLPNDVPDLLNAGDTDKIYEVILTAAHSVNGCSDADTVAITVQPGAKSEFAMDVTSAICSETEVQFTNLNIKTGVRYIWNWGDGEPNDTTTSEQSISHGFLNASTSRDKQFEVSLTAINLLSGCEHVSRQRIRVNPTVEVSVRPDKTAGCAPLEVNFRNDSRNVATHQWFVRLAGTGEQEQQQLLEEGYFMLDNTTASVLDYEVVYIGTSSTGCADTAVHTIKVHPELDPAFSTDSLRLRLPNRTFQIFNETPHADSWTYHWDFGDGESSSEVDPGAHTYATYGKYTITLTVSNDLCSESFQQDVVVNEILPIVDFQSIPVEGCWPLVVNFENKSQFADPNTYYWDFGDGEGYATSENPEYTYYKPGEYTVTLSASNPSGEVVSTSYAIVRVFERPRIDFELRDQVVHVPGDPLYVANHTRGATSYLWDFGDGTTYTEAEPVHEYQEPGVYTITLIAENEWGCADTLVKEEVVKAIAGGKAKIPNAFTPSASGSVGGDISVGNNDVFFPMLEGGVNRYNLKIYNRWGELLFESNKREIGWDGYYKGRLCKSDVYVYKLSVEFSDGKAMEKLGDVTLIR